MLRELISRLVGSPLLGPSIWTSVGFGINQFLRLASNLILARLLMPEAFGLMAIVTIIMVGLDMFTDVGLNTSLVQNRHGDNQAFINTAWTIKIIRGFVIAAILLAIGSPVAEFYNEPQISEVIPYLASCAILAGLSSAAPSVAHRNLWLGRLTVMTISAQVCSIVVMVTWAWFSPTVWALVAGYVTSNIVSAILSHCIFPNCRMAFLFDRRMALEIINFGKWVFLTSILVFLAGQLDRMTLAKLTTLDIVGLYSIGFMWAYLPLHIATVWSSNIILPLASRELRDTSPRKQFLINYRRVLVFTMLLVCIVEFATLHFLFSYLYNSEYKGAIWFFDILLFGTVVRVWDESYRVFNLSAGNPVYTALGSFLSIVIFGLAVFPLFRSFGAYGVAIAYAASQFGSVAAGFLGARKVQLSDAKSDAAGLSLVMILAVGYYNIVFSP